MTEERAHPLGWWRLAALFFTGFASGGLSIVKPLIVGALIDSYDFTPRQAGLVAGTEMLGIGMASLCAGILAARWDRRTLLLVGAALGLMGSLVPLIHTSFPAVLGLRLVAGIGAGLVAVAVISLIGSMPRSDRLYGVYFASVYVCAAVLLPVTSHVIAKLGADGAYGLLAVLLMPIFLFRRAVPQLLPAERTSTAMLQPFLWSRGLALLIASTLFWTGGGAVWAFIERLGLQAGLLSTAVGTVLSVGQLASIAGGVIAATLHTRYGRLAPVVGSVLISVLAVLLVGWAEGAGRFTSGALLFSLAWTLVLSYMNGTMAAADAAGRIIALAVATQTIGMAIGQAGGGALANAGEYESVAVLGCATQAISAIILLISLIRWQRAAGTVPSTA